MTKEMAGKTCKNWPGLVHIMEISDSAENESSRWIASAVTKMFRS